RRTHMTTRWLAVVTLAGFLAGTGSALAQAEKKPAKEFAAFGTLRSAAPDAARAQAQDWLKSVGKTDAASLKAFAAIWERADRPVIDKVADTFALGDDDARKLLAEARDPNTAAPTEVPELLRDAKRPIYYRANLALAYGKALSNRRVYDEAL